MFFFLSQDLNRRLTTLLMVIALCAFAVTPAFADDEVPPTPPDGGTSEVAADATDAEATPVAEGEATAPANDAASVEPEAEETSVTEPAPLLQDVPEDTNVIVVDANGEMVPLASEACANALSSVGLIV